MEKQYLTVIEFAQRAGISKQAVYKQVNNPDSRLQPYIITKGKRSFVEISALTELYNVDIINQPKDNHLCNAKTTHEVEKETQGVETQLKEQPQDNQPMYLVGNYIDYLKLENNQLHTIINQLQTQIDNLTISIQEKDRQLAEQAARINNQMATINQSMVELSNRALTTTTNQQTLAAMDKAAEPQPQIEETTEHSRSFWKRIFGK